jgi:hypothetical protein
MLITARGHTGTSATGINGASFPAYCRVIGIIPYRQDNNYADVRLFDIMKIDGPTHNSYVLFKNYLWLMYKTL